MGLQGYVGSAEDQARIRLLEKQRQDEKKRVEDAKKASAAKPAGFRKWQAGTVEVLEHAFKAETTGLVSRQEYIEKKATLEARLEAAAAKRKREKDQEAEEKFQRTSAQKSKLTKQSKLSFMDDADSDDEADDEGANDGQAQALHSIKLTKDDDVPTDFLPDADRERAMTEARVKLRQQWADEQARCKAQKLQLKYSYWDGSGHQRDARVRVGDTVADFLCAARTQLERDFPQLRHVTVPNLLLVKHDVILPNSMTFHRAIVGGAHNGSGQVLFALEGSAGKEKAHACKVVQRHWYESSKHIFPANRWVPFDEDVHMKKKD